jgi:hypothetical protein
MRRISDISGGRCLRPDQVTNLAEQFRERLAESRQQQEVRTTLWDRPLVLVSVLSAWLCCWIVRRRSGLV